MSHDIHFSHEKWMSHDMHISHEKWMSFDIAFGAVNDLGISRI